MVPSERSAVQNTKTLAFLFTSFLALFDNHLSQDDGFGVFGKVVLNEAHLEPCARGQGQFLATVFLEILTHHQMLAKKLQLQFRKTHAWPAADGVLVFEVIFSGASVQTLLLVAIEHDLVKSFAEERHVEANLHVLPVGLVEDLKKVSCLKHFDCTCKLLDRFFPSEWLNLVKGLQLKFFAKHTSSFHHYNAPDYKVEFAGPLRLLAGTGSQVLVNGRCIYFDCNPGHWHREEVIELYAPFELEFGFNSIARVDVDEPVLKQVHEVMQAQQRVTHAFLDDHLHDGLVHTRNTISRLPFFL